MADDNTRKKYGIDDILRRIPVDQGEFFRGFSPWQEDMQEWTLYSREALPAGNGRQLRRTIWNALSDPSARLLIDVTECNSAADAVEALADRLAENQLQQLPPGPPSLGSASFTHPEPAPPAVFFVTGNLMLTVSSFGRRPVDVIRFAEQIVRRVQDRSHGETSMLPITLEPARGRTGNELVLNYDIPVQLQENAFLKFFVSGATVSRDGNRILLHLQLRGRLHIEAFLVESGREARFGTLDVPIE